MLDLRLVFVFPCLCVFVLNHHDKHAVFYLDYTCIFILMGTEWGWNSEENQLQSLPLPQQMTLNSMA